MQLWNSFDLLPSKQIWPELRVQTESIKSSRLVQPFFKFVTNLFFICKLVFVWVAQVFSEVRFYKFW